LLIFVRSALDRAARHRLTSYPCFPARTEFFHTQLMLTIMPLCGDLVVWIFLCPEFILVMTRHAPVVTDTGNRRTVSDLLAFLSSYPRTELDSAITGFYPGSLSL